MHPSRKLLCVLSFGCFTWACSGAEDQSENLTAGWDQAPLLPEQGRSALGENLLANPSFASNLTGWTAVIGVPGEDRIEWAAVGGDGMLGAARFFSDGKANLVYQMQLKQTLRGVGAGTSYTLGFDVATTSDNARNVEVYIQQDGGDWTKYGSSTCALPETGVSRCEVTATVTETADVKFGIQGGDNLWDFTVDDASLVQNSATPPPPPPPPPGQTSSVAVGIFPGTNYNDIAGYEDALGVELTHRLLFQPVKSLSFAPVKRYLDQGYEVILNIEFFDDFPNLDEVRDGTYDRFLNPLADQLAADGRSVWLRPLHEFNGNWYNWGVLYDGSHTLQDFKDAWIHVVTLFRNRGANVKFQLNYNQSNGRNDPRPFSDFYPGDAFVDMVMVTCYNRAGTDQWHRDWRTFQQNFTGPYNQIRGFTDKPIGVAEMSSTSHGGDKPKWIRDAFASIASDFPRVEQITWFLINKQYAGEGERDWDLNTSADRASFVDGYRSLSSTR